MDKNLVIIACHTNNDLKYTVLQNNIKYFEKDNIDIILINSIEYEKKYNYSISDKIIDILFVKNNITIDFGKWVYVINNFPLIKNYKKIIFTNDSYIIVNKIDDYFEKVNNSEYDLYGYNDSLEVKYHYQSYLFAIKTDKINSLLLLFNENLPKINSIYNVIIFLELNLINYFNNRNCYLQISTQTTNNNVFFFVDNIYEKLLYEGKLPFIKIKRLYYKNKEKIIIPDFLSNILLKNQIFDKYMDKIINKNIPNLINNNIEKNISKAILFHVGNYEIFQLMVEKNKNFYYTTKYLFISVNNKINYDKIKKYMPNAFITLIENKGMDVGGFLNNLKCLFANVDYKNIDIFYIFHTKSLVIWRNNIYFPIINNYEIIEKDILQVKEPVIYGAKDYCFLNNKVINRFYIKEIYERNINIFNEFFTEHTLNSFMDEYYDKSHFDTKNTNNNCLDYYQFNHDFYKFYEKDLSNLSNLKIHYDKWGKYEYHRITNPYYIKKFGKESYFIAGTMFACNNLFISIFKNLNFDNEFDILEKGYVINNIPRKIHSWEYFFGLLVYSMNGYIKSISPNGTIQKMQNLNMEYNNDIYIKTNQNLILKNKNEYKTHFLNIGINENRIYSIQTLLKEQCIRNCEIDKSFIAFLININFSNNEQILIDYLKKINQFQTEKNIFVDLYFATSKNDINKYLGLSIVKQNIWDIYLYIKNMNIITNFDKINCYLGLELAKNYELLITIDEEFANNFPIYKNKSKKCILIIDNEQELSNNIF